MLTENFKDASTEWSRSMQHFHPKKSTCGTRAWSLRRERYVWEGKGTQTAALRRRSVVWNWLLCCGAYSLCLLPSHLDRQFAHGTRTTSSYTIARLFVGHCVVGYADLLFWRCPPLPPCIPIEREYDWSVSILPGSYSSRPSSIHRLPTAACLHSQLVKRAHCLNRTRNRPSTVVSVDTLVWCRSALSLINVQLYWLARCKLKATLIVLSVDMSVCVCTYVCLLVRNFVAKCLGN